MTGTQDQQQGMGFRRYAAAIAMFVIGLGLLVLLGWAIGKPGTGTDFVAMNPMTATLLIVLAASLLTSLQPGSPRRARQSRVLAAVVVLIAATKLAGVLVGWQAGLDTWMFAAQLADGAGGHVNRMAPNSAFALLFLGLSLFFIDATILEDQRPSEYLAAAASLIALLALFGYAYGVGSMAAIGDYIPMAWHSAVAFLLLASAVLSARPHAGWMQVLTGTGTGGAMARLMLPGLILLVTVLGWLRFEGEKRGLFVSGVGVAYFTLTIIIFGSILTLRAALVLNRTAARQIASEQARVRAFDDLKRSDARARSIVDTAYDAFISIDSAGLIIDWNHAAERMFGWTRSETIGKRVSDLIVPPGQRAAHEQGVRRCANLDEPRGDFLDRRVELSALRRDGGDFPIQMTIWPLGNASSRTYNAFIADISDRVQAETNIRLLHAELVANSMQLEQSNQELEAFSYSISHDLRAPLRHIDGYARMLHEDAADTLTGEPRRYLDEISESARRMGALIDDLLAFSRLGRKPLQRTEVDVRAMIREVLGKFEETSDSRVHLGDLPDAQADPVLLRQVWVNLISNALKYSSPRGPAARIEISGKRMGTAVHYRIHDNGVGFDMRYTDKLFGVFQRLHADEEFEGTGVGLAIVKRILGRHGGTITAEAEVGVGATFSFALPDVETASPMTSREETRP